MGKFQSVSDHCIIQVPFTAAPPAPPHSKDALGYRWGVKILCCKNLPISLLRLRQLAPTEDLLVSSLCRLKKKYLECVKKALIKIQTLLSQRKIIWKVLAKDILFSPFPICSSRTSQTQLSLVMLQAEQAGGNHKTPFGVESANLHWGRSWATGKFYWCCSALTKSRIFLCIFHFSWSWRTFMNMFNNEHPRDTSVNRGRRKKL